MKLDAAEVHLTLVILCLMSSTMQPHESKDCDEQRMSPNRVAVAKSCEHAIEQGTDQEDNEHVDLGRRGDRAENEEEEEDEEEDVDFNPFLKETPSREASSSLSSEIDGLDADVADSGGYSSVALTTESTANPSHTVQDFPVGDTDHGEEIVTETTTCSVERCDKVSESGDQYENQDGSDKLMNSDTGSIAGEINALSHSRKPVMTTDDEDAICMRTRARYSLASFTLDELENFLQETDDEDDLQNVDDEAEYRKFLAAVLQGGEDDTQGLQENENADDEDEESDADFELELEEALESENDEDARYGIQEERYEAVGRRPKTRQNRRQKASVGANKKLSGHRSLRPLLPCVPIMQRPSFSTLNGTNFMCNPAVDFLASVNNGSINGFTPHQIGQLHCLIHEHVQLLIQVFSVCVLEASKRHIAAEVQQLILEMLNVREDVLAWRRQPHPSFCFFPPCIHPSVPSEIPKSLSEPPINKVSSVMDECQNYTSGNNMVPPDIIAASKGRGGSQHIAQDLELSSWVPSINGPVMSVMDVAPLKVAANFVKDVSVVVQEWHRRQLEVICDPLSEKEPLFPLNNLPDATEPRDQVLRDVACPASTMVQDKPPKRSMASTLVEKAKKQSVALVPKEIAQLAWRFYPLFNPALYPHKPPPSSVANRLLFTDAEDELLALGLMEYNTDWKAIQQRFLPCKSKQQIFIRQKNRSSSKAPENPIKAVRRMKTSPLTTEEIARIEEGLKIYKLDWISIWKFIVPYRDPSLLPRQWRTAIGTQKSYKLDANKKAKRQLYDLRRRNRKSAELASWQSSPEKEANRAEKAAEDNRNGDNQMEREDEAYVHEAFLADWRPGTSKVSPSFPESRLQEKTPPIQTPSREGSQVREQLNSSESGEAQLPITNEFPAAVRSLNTQVQWRPYRARRVNNTRVVKLAPDLPPVNLPPSVRVMSQSAFKTYQTRATIQTCTADTSVVNPEAGHGVLDMVNYTANSRVHYPVKTPQVTRILGTPSSSNQLQQDSVITRKRLVEERKDESDLQMHPLLFQAPEDGRFPYYPLHLNASISSVNFLARSPPQLNLSLFHNPKHARSAVNFPGKPSNPKEATSYQTDFHPLLQRSAEDTNSSWVAAQLSGNLEMSEGRCAQVHNPLHATDKMSSLSVSSTATSLGPVSPSDKSNELDLDIHLSFPSRQPNDVGSRAFDRSSLRSHKAKNSPIQSHQYVAANPDRKGSNFGSGSPMVTVTRDDGIRRHDDNIEDQPFAEIVMEQEELSDSEDEIGENVEFECEEMADSEAEEESESEQMVDPQNEEVEESEMSRDYGDKLSSGPASKIEGGSRMNKNLDTSSSCHHLNLNSCPQGSPFIMAPGRKEGVKGLTDNCVDTRAIEYNHSKQQQQQQQQLQNLEPEPMSKKSRKRGAAATHAGFGAKAASKRRITRLSSDMNE